ncbi:family 1 glycoside hydrolase [Plectosphaerella plurivora]|uniref:Family 1 glycoside hydrolase n=1 Tax=Plectosphaerella plurivora TaxID=936078 RepID=A0A9P9AAW6_9PEZI|nr:family 1 glycoside hydrolase [Plectosphaerella plurivora]
MLMTWAPVALAAFGAAQQVFIPADGPTSRPQCTACTSQEPQYTFTPFSHTMTDTVRYATSVPPATTTATYAAPSESLTSLVTSVSYTSWGKWDPNATSTADDSTDPFGSSAWTALWEFANPPNFTETSVYSSTVSPTAVPSSELVLPPRDYFGPQDCYRFPKNFRFGVSSSASQIEGATADEGKSPSLMDILIRDDRPKSYVTNENYYYYKQDIERVAAMGVSKYAFSIAWTRILPFALPGTPVNQLGIDHYSDVIDFILEKGMTPEVTLLHFDTPLQFYGANLSTAADRAPIGYVNGAYQNETFPAAFVNYAKIVMSHYADRVPVWYTFNEPLLYAYNGVSIDHVIKSHAEVYHFYKEELNGTGQISLRLNNNFGVPRNPESEADVYAAEHFNSFQLGPFANPIFLGLDYPDSFKETISDHVPLSAEDLAYLNGTADFFSINHYTATVVAPPVDGDVDSVHECAGDYENAFRPYCVNQTTSNIFGWNIGYRSQSYVYTTPTYLRSYLNYVYNTWRRPVVITEFGFPIFAETQKALPDQLFDTPRSNYYLSYMSEVLKAIWEDGVDVAGAYAWSFADNWEFGDGASNFGIQTVNRTTQTRNYKKSFFDLVDFMKARGV